VNPLQVPQWGPYGERYLHTEHYYISPTYLLGSPVKEPSLQVPLMEPQERDAPFLELSFSHHSKSLGYEPRS